MTRVYLSLGSNLGERIAYLKQAVGRLGRSPHIQVEAVSKIYETSPVGGVEQGAFLNIAVRLTTSLAPLDLLDVMQAIERNLKRERLIHWGPRTIDIDLLYYGDQVIQTERLTVPHQELFNRLFVLVPLMDVWTDDFPNQAAVWKRVVELEDQDQEIQCIGEWTMEKCKTGSQEGVDQTKQERIEAAVREILLAVGEDPDREGLLETPKRVAKMYAEILSSMEEKEFTNYKLFESDTAQNAQMVSVNDIPFFSMCEHHLLPFFGTAHVAYIPKNGRIIGLSKIPRLVDYVSHRLNLQERITKDIADTLEDILEPYGVAVVIDARHMCVEMRGVKKTQSVTRTSFFTGEFDRDRDLRNEFLQTVNRYRA